MKKQCIVLFAQLLSVTILLAQPAGDNVVPSERLRLILEEIKEAASSNIVIKLQESTQVSNAEAYRDGSNNYIRYNPAFVREFEKDARTKWAVYALLAHEMGHLVLGHDLHENRQGPRKELELNADNFAGRILNTLCASREEALAGFRNMRQNETGGFYPSKADREYELSEGWEAQQEVWTRKGPHPCATTIQFDTRLGSYLPGNWAKNSKAIIKGGRMEFNYKVAPDKDIPKFNPYLMIDPRSPLVPQSLDWIGDSTLPGNRTLIWYFERDGYSREQVERPDEIGIGAFSKKMIPRKPKAWIMPLEILSIGVGIGAIAYGVQRRRDAIQNYNNVYVVNRNPNSAVYTAPNSSRNALYKELNRQQKLAWIPIGIGAGAVITGGITWLCCTHPKAKRAKKVLLYQ